MSLWGKIMQIFGYCPHLDLADVALQRSQHVGRKADALNATLSGYLTSEDPFRAFATDVFERGQEARIHQGPPH